MQKKEIYDYLAQTYLSNSKSRVVTPEKPRNLKKQKLFFSGVIVLISVIIVAFIRYYKPAIKSGSNASVQIYNITPSDEIIRIKYDFSDSSNVKNADYNINLNSIDLRKYNFLHINMRKAKDRGAACVDVGLSNQKNQTQVYPLSGVKMSWKDFEIDLSQLKKSMDFSCLSQINFLIAKEKIKEKQDIVYIEDVKFTE